MAVRFDLTGRRFGRLAVLCQERTEKEGSTYRRCQCDRGNECVVVSKCLRNGRTLQRHNSN